MTDGLFQSLGEFCAQCFDIVAATKDCSVCVKKYKCGDVAHTISSCTYGLTLGTKHLQEINTLFLQCSQRVFGEIVCGNTHNYKAFVLILVIDSFYVGNLSAAGATPACPEINQHYVTFAYVV